MTFWQIWLRQRMQQPNWRAWGKKRWNAERPLRLAGEAVIGCLVGNELDHAKYAPESKQP